MVQAPPLLSTRPLVSRKTTESTLSGNSKSREEHSRNEAQDHWERLVLTEPGDTSKLVTDLTLRRHLNSHIRQSVAAAAAGTLRKYLQQWTFWSEWALECAIHPGQPTQADMADTGARQDRSRVRTSSVAGAIQSLKFVRKAQVEPLLAILDTPLIAGYLAGAAIPRPRREALPLPLAVLVQWERWICSGSAPEHEILLIGSTLLMGMGRLPRRRAAHMSLVASRQTCPSRRVLANQSLQIWQPFGALAFVFFWSTSKGLGPRVLQCASQLALPDGVSPSPPCTADA